MREKFREALSTEGLDAACRAEDGNFKYDYYMSTDSDDEMLLVASGAGSLQENWRAQGRLRRGSSFREVHIG